MPPKTVKDKKKIENITNQLNNSVHILNHLSTEIESLMKINEVTRVVQKFKKLVKTVNDIEQFKQDMQVINRSYSLQHDDAINQKEKALKIIEKTYDTNHKKIKDVEELVKPILNILGINPDNDIIQKVARRVNSNFSYIDEMIGLHKMARFLLFIFMFFFYWKNN